MYNCPQCQAMIALDDVNISTDIALCRSCNEVSAFSELHAKSEVPDNIEALSMPKGFRSLTDMEFGKVLIFKKISPVALFLIPFTAVWSGGSMWGIYGTQFMKGKFELTQSLFGIPFLLGTIILVSITTFCVFAKRTVKMSKGRGQIFTGVGPIGKKKTFLYHPNTSVSIVNSSMRQNNRVMKCIEIQGGSKSLKFAAGLKDSELEYMAAFIKNKISEA